VDADTASGRVERRVDGSNGEWTVCPG
jgi:hypothetical protein